MNKTPEFTESEARGIKRLIRLMPEAQPSEIWLICWLIRSQRTSTR